MHTCYARMRILALVPILAVCLALATGTAIAADFWVDANAGNDGNPGSQPLPFATITHAITTGGELAIIYVLPGTYDAAHGEVFPITLLAGQRLIGDPTTKGAGTEATMIIGKGAYAGLSGIGKIATVVCGPSSEISGFQIDADSYVIRHAGVVIDGQLAVVRDNQMLGSSYAGVFMIDAQASAIRDNEFRTSSYGVYLVSSPDTPVIEGNLFVTPALSVDLAGNDSNPWVHANVFQAGSRVCVQVQHGFPLIEGNTFEAGSGTVYGGVLASRVGALPIVRSNTFLNALGVRILNDATPDLGTSGDPGQNNFQGVVGVCIQHDGTSEVSAIGNTWPNDPPVMGVDIILNDTGSVILFGVPVEPLSFGRLKAVY